jgi:hypothetical protein
MWMTGPISISVVMTLGWMYCELAYLVAANAVADADDWSGNLHLVDGV